MRRSLLVLALATMVTLAGCDSDRRAISRDDLPDVPRTAAVVVEMGDDGFTVDEITVDEVEVGTEELVEFVNVGEEDHGIRTEESTIDTGLIFPGESTFVIFDTEGSYELFDVADSEVTMTVTAVEAVNVAG